ncbi:MAG: 3'(2'),5'-bisphosphate nucleotidase CysQ [Gammaproteobacteria bacterium]|nr:3'(2'),5'-bisphosphate nucleotidase CysQ [Gammaproteobacteria bacterium]
MTRDGMTPHDRRRLLELILPIARAAGDAIMSVYQREFDVELKDDRSPLTEADSLSHDVITDALASLRPALPVLSEEASGTEHRDRRSWDPYWLVDPLDGTKEFIKRNGEFTVNIALIEAHAPVLGVVLAPALGVEYYGGAGIGAWRRAAGQDARGIRVSVPAAGPLRVVGSRSHPSGTLATYLERLGAHELKPMGSSLKICLVAEGEADVYPRFGPTSEWDTAAAQAVLEGAGGVMMDTDGQPLRYNRKDDLLNPHFLAVGDQNRDWLGPLKSTG